MPDIGVQQAITAEPGLLRPPGIVIIFPVSFAKGFVKASKEEFRSGYQVTFLI